MSQGGALDIVSCGIGVLPIIKWLKLVFTDVTQTWYADDSSALGKFYNIGLYFNLLKHFGPGHGYYPELSKRVLIVHPNNPATGKEFWFASRV